MDVAEDVRNPLAIEVDGASRAGFVESKVEALAVEERKNIMEPGIAIGELHRGSLGDDQQVRFESLVLLLQHRMHRRGTCSANWTEPHDRRIRGGNVRSSLQNHVTGNINVLSPQACAHAATQR